MGNRSLALPSWGQLDGLLRAWLLEDIGRGDWSTDGLFGGSAAVAFPAIAPMAQAIWVAKEAGRIAGLPIAQRVFQLLDEEIQFVPQVAEGAWCDRGTVVAQIEGAARSLLTGERTALNLAMRLSGIATMTGQFCDRIADLPTQVVDTRKTTPGLRILEKYAVRAGGGRNHRMGLDDAMMLKDNHIAAAGGITAAIAQVRACAPYPMPVEVETESLAQVSEAIAGGADIIMLDNMPVDLMRQAVSQIRAENTRIKIEASGNVTLDSIRAIAETGVDYISTSAMITRSSWLDLSMKLTLNGAQQSL